MWKGWEDSDGATLPQSEVRHPNLNLTKGKRRGKVKLGTELSTCTVIPGEVSVVPGLPWDDF